MAFHCEADDEPAPSPVRVVAVPHPTNPFIAHLEDPMDIAITAAGDFVVSECEGDCVSIFSSDGKRKWKLDGVYGSSSGTQLDGPKGVAVDAGGNILVVNANESCIQQLSLTGCKTVGSAGTLPLQFQCPEYIAIHPHTHQIYVADCENQQVQVLNSDFSYSQTLSGRPLDGPCGLAFDAKGTLYVADICSNRVVVIPAHGKWTSFGGFGEEEGMFNSPTGIAVDQGIVYVADPLNRRVSMFDEYGNFIDSFVIDGSPYGLAVDKNRVLYVCDGRRNCVKAFQIEKL